MMNVEFSARVHEENGSFWAEVIELLGCFAAGDDLNELKESLREAISLVLQEDFPVIEFGEPTNPQHSERRELLVPS